MKNEKPRKTTLLILAFFIILLKPVLSETFPIINEVMYNPPGLDNNHEFVEISHEPGLNLTDYMIADSDSNDTLALLRYVEGNYSLIVEEGFNFSGLNCSVYSVGATIGNDLGNSNDSVSLFDSNKTLLDFMHYNGSIANANNRTIERLGDIWEESLVFGGTPCAMNSVVMALPGNISNLTGEINSSLENITTAGFTLNLAGRFEEQIENESVKIFLVINLSQCSLNDSGYFLYGLDYDAVQNRSPEINNSAIFNMNKNGFPLNISILNSSLMQNFTACFSIKNLSYLELDDSDNSGCFYHLANNSVQEPQENETSNTPYFIDILFNQTYYNASDSILFRFVVPLEQDYIIEYWIENFLGEIVKSKRNSTNCNEKTWKIASERANETFYIKAGLFIANNSYLEPVANSSASFFAYRNGSLINSTNETSDDKSKIEILNATYDKSKNCVELKLDLYRGDTLKSVVYYWIESDERAVCAKEKEALESKYSSASISKCLNLTKTCGLGQKSNFLAVEGLGFSINDSILIDQDDCEAASSPAKAPKASSVASVPFIPAVIDPIVTVSELNGTIEINGSGIYNLSFEVYNPGPSFLRISFHSYIYRSSKCYSCENNRSENEYSTNIFLGRFNFSQGISLLNISPGQYKLKLVYLILGKNKTYEKTFDVEIVNSASYQEKNDTDGDSFGNNVSENMSNLLISDEISQLLGSESDNSSVIASNQRTSMAKGEQPSDMITSNVIYEGTAQKAKKLIYYLILFSLIILGVILIWKGKDGQKNHKGKAGIGLHPGKGSDGADRQAEGAHTKHSRSDSKID